MSGAATKLTMSPSSNTILSESKVNVSPAGKIKLFTTLVIALFNATPLGRKCKSKFAASLNILENRRDWWLMSMPT